MAKRIEENDDDDFGLSQEEIDTAFEVPQTIELNAFLNPSDSVSWKYKFIDLPSGLAKDVYGVSHVAIRPPSYIEAKGLANIDEFNRIDIEDQFIRMLTNCINISKLKSVDRTFILLTIRSELYPDSAFELEVECDGCQKTLEFAFPISYITFNEYKLESLEIDKFKFNLSLPTHGDVISFEEALDQIPEEQRDETLEFLSLIIGSIEDDGEVTSGVFNCYNKIAQLPNSVVMKLVKRIESSEYANGGIQTTPIKLKCTNLKCNHEMEVSVDVADLFHSPSV